MRALRDQERLPPWQPPSVLAPEPTSAVPPPKKQHVGGPTGAASSGTWSENLPDVTTAIDRSHDVVRQLAAEIGSEQKTGEIGEQVKAGNEMPLERVKDILLTAHAMYNENRDARADGDLEDAVVDRAHADLQDLIRQWVSSFHTTQAVIQNTRM